MTDAPAHTVKIHLGDYEVVVIEPARLGIHLGKHVVIYIYPLGRLPTPVKLGDKLPLFTELPLVPPNPTSS